MKNQFKDMFKDKIIMLAFTITSCIVCITAISIGIFYKSLPPFLPIYNSMPWGYTRIGTRLELFIPLIIVIIFSLLNLFMTSLVYKKIILLARFLSATACMLSITVFIFSLEIIFLVK